jgi:hypothetical protein
MVRAGDIDHQHRGGHAQRPVTILRTLFGCIACAECLDNLVDKFSYHRFAFENLIAKLLCRVLYDWMHALKFQV